MKDWLKAPSLMKADTDAEYAAVIEIDLTQICEPIVCCPNDPDDAKLLSEVSGDTVDDVFIGSCMTNIGHFRAAGKLLDEADEINTRFWICPPTRMWVRFPRYARFPKDSRPFPLPPSGSCTAAMISNVLRIGYGKYPAVFRWGSS